jgi:hypothetical protein
MDAEVKANFEAAIGIVWDDFKAEHPSQAETIELQFGNPIQLVCTKLEQGPEYDALVKQTAEETSIANIVKIVAPIAMNVIMSFL